LPALSSGSYERLQTFIRTLLFERVVMNSIGLPPQEEANMVILRTKGLLALQDGNFISVQGVRELCEFMNVTHPNESLPSGGKLVFIGRFIPLDLHVALLAYINA